MQGKSCLVHPAVNVPTDFFFPSVLFPLFLFSLVVCVLFTSNLLLKKKEKNKCFFRYSVLCHCCVLPSQCSLFFPCDLFVCACFFPVCVCACVRVFLNSPCILLAAGAFIIRTCTVYCELSTRLSA